MCACVCMYVCHSMPCTERMPAKANVNKQPFWSGSVLEPLIHIQAAME